MSIQTQIERLTDAKAALKTAIEQKGVAVPEGAPLEQYAPLVEQITGENQYVLVEEGDFETDVKVIERTDIQDFQNLALVLRNDTEEAFQCGWIMYYINGNERGIVNTELNTTKKYSLIALEKIRDFIFSRFDISFGDSFATTAARATNMGSAYILQPEEAIESIKLSIANGLPESQKIHYWLYKR